MNQLIERSNALKTKLIKLAGGEKGKSLPKPQGVLTELETGAAQLLNLKSENDWVSVELRDHILDLYQRGVIGLVKRICLFE